MTKKKASEKTDKTKEDVNKKVEKDGKATADSEKEITPEENPFDFGGIPDRNLKKNLGCG